jgi:hypothetical protein
MLQFVTVLSAELIRSIEQEATQLCLLRKDLQVPPS